MDYLSALILSALVCLGLALWAISLQRKNTAIMTSLKAKDLELLELKKELSELEEKVTTPPAFDNLVSETTITTKLQSKRNQDSQDFTTPEKYQYIISLTKKGMKAEEISSILSISEHEARQLVSLAKISANSQRVS